MATEVSDPATEATIQREEWIQARMAEFDADPAMRDRAIATILCDIMLAAQSVGQLTGLVQKEGLAGAMKAMAMGMFGGKKNGKAGS